MRAIIDPRRLLAAAILAGLACCFVTLAACHTVEGAGKDIEGLGEAVQDAADDD